MQCFGRKLVANMDRHRPWVLKDPRMALTMPLWQPLLAQQVCVFVVKDPVKNAMSLAANGKKSSESSAPPRLPALETGLHALVLHVMSCHVMNDG